MKRHLEGSEFNSPKKSKKQEQIKDLIKVSLYTKLEGDGKDESDLKNWTECDFRILNPDRVDDDEEVEQQSIVEQNNFVSMVCHIKDFDKHKYTNEDGDELEKEDSTPIPDRVRFGIHIENETNHDLNIELFIDEIRIRTPLVRRKSKEFSSYDYGGVVLTPLLVRRHELAFDEREVNREAISMLGIIKVSIFQAEILSTSYSKERMVNNSLVVKDVKIKSSMVKDSSMSLELGPVKTVPDCYTATVIKKEKLLEYQIKYRNYTGFLLEIVRAGLTVQQAKSQMSETPQAEEEVVEISDGEDNEPPPIVPTQPTRVTPPISATIMEKITEKAHEIEAKNAEELVKYLKLKDEDLSKNIEKIFKKEGIDGVAFLLLTVELMQPLKLRIGDQVKIKQIVQQIKENSGY